MASAAASTTPDPAEIRKAQVIGDMPASPASLPSGNVRPTSVPVASSKADGELVILTTKTFHQVHLIQSFYYINYKFIFSNLNILAYIFKLINSFIDIETYIIPENIVLSDAYSDDNDNQ